jgi:uncharacterized membrane protein
MLSYLPVGGWIAAVYVLAAQRFRTDRTTRFHAFQGLYLFVAWLLIDWGTMPVFGWGDEHIRIGLKIGLRGLIKLALFAAGVIMMVKTNSGENFRLPVIGDLAERSVSEQR